jgi:hypothetical protein
LISSFFLECENILMSKFPKVAVEDGIGLDLEGGHGGSARASGIDIGYAVYFFRALSKKATSAVD